ncbi:MAG TPA: hypothetical protein VMV48_08560 [Gallionellaceae bacterium]|nr:hypothetical protein [Gallionellaceae bacterium]
MFVTNGSNTIAHADADCHCSSCKQSLKPDKIVAMPSAIFRQGADMLNNAAIVKRCAASTPQSGSNVISLSAAIKSAGQARRQKAEKAKFNYPMLECS